MKQANFIGSPTTAVGQSMQHAVAPDMPSLETEQYMRVLEPLEVPSHEVLSQLAREDSQAYEALRRELLESFIESAPARHKRRLRGIQFRVDNERRLSRSALGSTVRVYQLMWKSFVSLNGEWQDLVRMKEEYESDQESTAASEFAKEETVRIIKFRPSR